VVITTTRRGNQDLLRDGTDDPGPATVDVACRDGLDAKVDDPMVTVLDEADLESVEVN
jgi:hypothetical protein